MKEEELIIVTFGEKHEYKESSKVKAVFPPFKIYTLTKDSR